MNLKRRTHNVRQHWSWHPPLDFRPTQGTFRSRPEAWRTSLHKPQEATVDPMHPEPLPLPGGSLLTTSTAAAWNWNPDHPPPDFSPAAWRPPSWLSPVYWQDNSASDDATSQSRPPQAPTAAKATAPEFASVFNIIYYWLQSHGNNAIVKPILDVDWNNSGCYCLFGFSFCSSADNDKLPHRLGQDGLFSHISTQRGDSLHCARNISVIWHLVRAGYESWPV
ncbi:hypothetical protein KCU88_g2833, partial [Aureobasidium melanogenum]